MTENHDTIFTENRAKTSNKNDDDSGLQELGSAETDNAMQTRRNNKLLSRKVARYLLQNPDFFTEHVNLLEMIQVPKERGKTASLMTHQSNLLRERNIEMRQRLNQLVNNAQENDQLFLHSRRLILTLLEARTVGEASKALQHSFREDFAVEHVELILFEPLANNSHAFDQVRRSSLADAEVAVGSILRNKRTVCGTLRPSEMTYLFDGKVKFIASSAVVPLANQLGILAVGSSDHNHYHSSLETLFLSYIGEILERLLPGLLASS